MSLVSDIIRDAYRESNINPIGVAPSAAQADEALRFVNRLIPAAYDDAGEHLRNYPIGNDNIQQPAGYGTSTEYAYTFIPTSHRMALNLTGPVTVYLDPNPHDGARVGVTDIAGNTGTYNFTIEGNGRLIGGQQSFIVNTNSFSAEWMYRDDLANWVLVSPLGYNDTWPFPPEFDDMFIVMLAMRLNPRNGAPMDPQSMAALKESAKNFKAQYAQRPEVHSEFGLLRLSQNKRWRGTWGGTEATAYFNRGGWW